jgi:hypothetical protein
MTSMTPILAPADLPGLGGFDVCPPFGPSPHGGFAELVAVHIAAPTAPVQGTGLPAGGIAARLRPVAVQGIAQAPGHDVLTTTFDNNGTTLGIHSSRRPQS